MGERKTISKRVRFEIFKRDEFTCVYCGAHPPQAVMEIDHVVPVAEGGGNDIDNLATACWDCNRGKGPVPLDSVPQQLADKAEMVAEREAQLRAYYEILQAKRDRTEGEIWAVAEVFMHRFCDESITRNRFQSIRRFIELLNFYEVLEAMEIAADQMFGRERIFAYFCGICWRKIKEGGGK